MGSATKSMKCGEWMRAVLFLSHEAVARVSHAVLRVGTKTYQHSVVRQEERK